MIPWATASSACSRHYRKSLVFSWENLDNAQGAIPEAHQAHRGPEPEGGRGRPGGGARVPGEVPAAGWQRPEHLHGGDPAVRRA